MAINREERFIEKSTITHNGFYIYTKVKYINNSTKVCIICPIHGEFWQAPKHHMNGCGCPKCKGKNRTTEELINDFKKVHGERYDYSKVNFIKTSQKVCVGCKIHGYFYVTPNHHLKGVGCSKCGGSCRSDKEEFTEKANVLYNNIYDYTLVEYVNANTKVCIGCSKHGLFWKTPSKHLNGQGCPKCAAFGSKAENEIIKLLSPLSIETHNRTILGGKEIDIYIPSLKLGIEYNGLKWHTELNGKDKEYHLNKLQKCNEQGIKLIQIFEDEWINKKEICQYILQQTCGIINKPNIDINLCSIKVIENNVNIYNFINNNCISQCLPFSFSICALYNNILIGVLTFKSYDNNCFELRQIVPNIDYQCNHLEEKLFNYFINHYRFNNITAIADRRWVASDENSIYTSLGFRKEKYIKPIYCLYNSTFNHYKRYNEKELNKNELCERFNLPLSLSKKEVIKNSNFTKIWNCGFVKYIYNNGSPL